MNTPATDPSAYAIDYTDIANRAQEALGRGVNPSTAKAIIKAYEAAREIDAAPAAAVGGAMRYKTPEELANGDSRIPIPAGGFVLSEKDNEWWWQRTDHMNPEARNRVRELLRSMQKITTAQPSAKDGVRDAQHGGPPMTLRECMEAEEPTTASGLVDGELLALLNKHRRHVELSPGVGADAQSYALAVIDDICSDIGLADTVSEDRAALVRVRAVMGPVVPKCCQGCEWELGEALRIIEAAIGREVGNG